MAPIARSHAIVGAAGATPDGLPGSLFDGTAIAVLLLVIGVLVAGCVVGLTGFGFSLFTVPVLTLLLPPRTGIPLSITISLTVIVASLSSPRIRAEIDRAVVWRLLRASLVGIPIGVLIFLSVPETVLRAMVGTVTVGYALSVIPRTSRVTSRIPTDPSRGLAALAGVASGVLAGSTGLSGPPVAAFLHRSGLASGTFRATLLAYFLPVGTISIMMLAAAGRVDVGLLSTAALLAPAALSGMAIGRSLFTRVPVKLFQRLVIGLLLLAGALNVGKALL